MPVGGFRPGSVARTPGLRPARGRRALPDALRLGAGRVHVDRGRRRRRAAWAAGRWASTRWTGRSRVRDIFRRRRMWRPRPALKGSYDVVIIGGGSHGLATAYYLRERGITDVCILEKSYIGSGAAGRNTTILRSNYKTPEGARFYDASVKLYEGLSQRAELQPALLAVRPPHARALRPRAVRDGQPRRGQPPAGHRLAPDRARRGQAPGPGHVRRARRDLSDHGRALPPARRHHPPRRRGLGPGPRRRRGRRRDPPLHRGPRPRAQQRPRRRGAHQPRHDPRRAGRQLHGGLEHAAVRHGRRRRCRSPPTSCRRA